MNLPAFFVFQEYILLCCQKVFYMRPGLSVPSPQLVQQVEAAIHSANGSGGLIDRPGKNVDPYHTCYALSGLSVAQHSPRRVNGAIDSTNSTSAAPDCPFPTVRGQDVAGSEWGNELADVDPRYNIVGDAVAFACTYYDLMDSGDKVDQAEAIARAIDAAEEIAFKPTLDVELRHVASSSSVSEINIPGAIEEQQHERQLPQICTSPWWPRRCPYRDH